MKKPRFGIMAKIILLTGLLTILTISTSLVINLSITHHTKKASFISSCEEATDIIESGYTSGEENVEKLAEIVDVVITDYLTVRDNYKTMSEQEILEYQNALSTKLFGAKAGQGFGMSLNALERRNYYTTALSNTQTVASTFGIPSTTFFIFDKEYNYTIYIFIGSVNVENNLDTIGKVTYDEDDAKTIEFFNSNKEEITLSDKNFLYAYNNVAIKNLDNNFACFIEAQYPLAEFNASYNQQLITELIVTVGSAVFLVIIYSILTQLFLIKNVSKLKQSTSAFVQKLHNDEPLEIIDSEVKSHDEIKDLSDEFMVMQEQIITYVDNIKTAKQKEEQMQAEINIASKIQLESLPADTYFDGHLELHALIQPAKIVGGDFYDYFYIDKTHLAFAVADVSGKGIPASLFMMRAKESMKSSAMNENDLSKVLYKVNNSLVFNNKEGYFVTALLGILDLETNKINIISAGHEKPFIKHNGKVSKVEIESNFVLGLVENFKYKAETIQLEQGDELFLYTDGLNEAINSNKEEFGYDRIAAAFEVGEQPTYAINESMSQLEQFRGEEEQFDDITIICLKVRGELLILEKENPVYDDISVFMDKAEAYLKDVDINTIRKVGTIIDEAMNNVISYGKAKTDKKITLIIEKQEDGVVLNFIDNSHPFNPLARKNRTVQENLEAGIVGGLGISIIKTISKKSEYTYSNNKNILTVKI